MRNKSPRARGCAICNEPMRKNGRTAAGAQRWKCSLCSATFTFKRADLTKAAIMAAFVGYVLGKQTQNQVDPVASSRSIRRRFAWCWNIEIPQPPVTGEIYRQIIVDGTYFQGWCLLVAHNGKHVIGWQWCDRENKAAWAALLERFPAPDVVVTDGGTGLRAALDLKWKRTRIQRCYFHIFAAVRRHTTLNPRLEAGKEILALTRQLMRVNDLDEAATWMGDYATWEAKWAQFLKERTYPKIGVQRPRWVKPSQKWWWTHISLRRVQGLYRHLIRDQSLFTWLNEAYQQDEKSTVARTTSRLEGGVNAGIKELLRRHRGMNENHARTAVEWHLNALTEFPRDPWQTAQKQLKNPRPAPEPQVKEKPIGPTEYDTGLSAEEGLWTRKGWAGRSH
ncbi:MAG TPA: IS1249 family transposase [Actinomycetales bacterium]|nr:IS1249 family transposase [Actinomycetales bacterium]